MTLTQIPYRYKALVIGVSAGGLKALGTLLPRLSPQMVQPVIIVQHLSPDSDDFLVQHFDKLCRLKVREVEDKLPMAPGTIYFAPANYHTMVEEDLSFALSTAERVQYARPSIDVLFETAAEAFKRDLVALILTGANSDGANGILAVKRHKGYAIAQSPSTAEVPVMPAAAIAAGVDTVADLEDLAPLINGLMSKK